MKLPGMLLVLTLVNLMLVSILLARGQKADARNELSVLRGRALEIVDDQGRVRASINIFPTDPKFKTADGKPYPETVLLRLINSNGAPNVKLSASNDGAALGLGGASNPTYIQVIAAGDETFVNMTNKDGKKQTLKPGRRNGPTPYFPRR
ncbi:MAG TPA: hypothetical protein VFB38_13575 [Chthonomonadaceae bacterium]|nr:hypothetical protein [Chthonomonadaceae bacterium]